MHKSTFLSCKASCKRSEQRAEVFWAWMSNSTESHSVYYSVSKSQVSGLAVHHSQSHCAILILKPSKVPAFFKAVYDSWRKLQNLFRAIHEEHIFAFNTSGSGLKMPFKKRWTSFNFSTVFLECHVKCEIVQMWAQWS